MFGGLKKKLQEAINKVSLPKKEELEQEIAAEQLDTVKDELRDELRDLEMKETEAREHIQTRTIEEPEHKIEQFEDAIARKQHKEDQQIDIIQKDLAGPSKESIQDIAIDEFKRISHAPPAEIAGAHAHPSAPVPVPQPAAAPRAPPLPPQKEHPSDSLNKISKELSQLSDLTESLPPSLRNESSQPRAKSPSPLAGSIQDLIDAAESLPPQLRPEMNATPEPTRAPPVSKTLAAEQRATEAADKLVHAVSTQRLAAETRMQQAAEPEQKRRGFIAGIVRRIAEKSLEHKDIQDIVKNLQLALLENDTALEVAEQICDEVQAALVGTSVKRGEVETAVKHALRTAMLRVMEQEPIDIEALLQHRTEPLLVMVLGFNGVGKTTNLAKLAYKFKHYHPILAAGDTFRAASIEQLEEHGRRIGVKVIKHQYGADSAAVIFDAKKHAAANGVKLVLADTAGRSHSNANLMDELKKVARVNQPDLKILVLDSLTGNDIYEQAKLFNDAVGVDGIILTKADVYDKGGAALSAAYTLKKPVLYLGVGQNYEDLKEFRPEDVVKSLLD